MKTQNSGVQKERFQYIYEITMLFYSGYKIVGVWGVVVIFSLVYLSVRKDNDLKDKVIQDGDHLCGLLKI